MPNFGGIMKYIALLIALVSFGCTHPHLPKFKESDRVCMPTYNEFRNKVFSMYVLKVGKRNYFLGSDYPYNPRAYNTEMDIDGVDGDSHLCKQGENP
jgi:hypothetical protein